MKTIIALLLFIMMSSGVFAQTDEVVTLKTETGKIEGSLMLPVDNEGQKLALIISGSGPTDRNGNSLLIQNNSLKMLAEGLAENGIASFRYDKRGVGKSQSAGLSESELRFDHYVNDVVLWLGFLKEDPRFSEFIVIGHSEGALIGMLASQKSKVDKFISIAGIGMPANMIIRKQLQAQPPVVLQQANPILEKLEKGETTDAVPSMLNSLFRPSLQPYLISWFKYDPAIEISKLEIPVQIVQGTTDIQIGTENAEMLLKSNKKAEKVIFEGMNHVLKEAELDQMKNLQTYNQPDLPLAGGLIMSIVDFIK